MSRLAEIGTKFRNGVALRRATRVALVVPLLLLALTSVPYLKPSALFGVFAGLAMMLFADFGGPLLDRFVAYLITTALGIPILLIGITFGQSVIGAVIVMALVAFTVGIAAVLRGPVSSAQTVLLLATVLAVTSAPPGTQVPAVIAWTIGGVTAALAALILWPARPSHQLAKELSQVYDSAALTIRARWAEPDADAYSAALERFDRELTALHGQFDGNLLRPAGLTDSDRALAQLVDLASRLRGYLKWEDIPTPEVPDSPELDRARTVLAEAIAEELHRVAKFLLDPGHRRNSPDRIKTAREEHLQVAITWVAEHRGVVPGTNIRRRLDNMFPLRLASISTELASANVAQQEVIDHFSDRVLDHELNRQRQGIWDRVTSNLAWDSPWFRSALRTAVALACSVALAKTLELSHGFWIVLGTLTALRFDALGTGRTAVQALVGTTVGVLIGAGLIEIVGSAGTIWWVLLPIVLVITAYTPGTFSLAVGQAGFSVTVIVMFSLLYPATLATAETRLEDVAIGLAVSFAVSLLMWPSGVVATLHRRMRDAIVSSSDHLLMAIDYIAGGAVDDDLLSWGAGRATVALDRAQEAYDLSVAQKPPKTVPMQKWFRVAIAARHIDVAANTLPGVAIIVRDLGATLPFPRQLTGSVLEAAHDVRDHLRAVAVAWDQQKDSEQLARPDLGSEAPATPLRADGPIVALRADIDQWIDEPSDWTGEGPDPRPALLTWTADWNAFVAWNADRLQRALTEAVAPASR
ncbi:MAG: FUSC family protein [Candidatus Nanopelagicales bacterium]